MKEIKAGFNYERPLRTCAAAKGRNGAPPASPVNVNPQGKPGPSTLQPSPPAPPKK